MATRNKIRAMIRFDLGEGSWGFIRARAPHTHEGLVYNPVPDALFSVPDLESGTGTTASGFTLLVSESPAEGVTPDVLRQIESYTYRDKPVTIYDMLIDPDTNAITDIEAVARGYIVSIRHRRRVSDGYTVAIECKTRSLDYSRKNGRVRSDEDQKRRTPAGKTDRVFEQAGLAGRIQLKWGKV